MRDNELQFDNWSFHFSEKHIDINNGQTTVTRLRTTNPVMQLFYQISSEHGVSKIHHADFEIKPHSKSQKLQITCAQEDVPLKLK